MKNLALILLACSFLFSSCKKLGRLLTFEISNSEMITIPATSLVAIPVVSPVPVTVNSQESFENNKTQANLVKDVSLQKLTLSITNPANETFNFLKGISIYIGTDQSDKILLASLDNIPMNVSSLQLISSNAKLDKYIKASSYTLYTEISLRAANSKDLTVKAESKFRVTADPL